MFSDEVLTDAPIANWRLNTLSGTEADLGSGGHTLTYANGPNRQQPSIIPLDLNTFSVNFPLSTQYASTPSTSDLTFIAAPFSVECAFNFSGVPNPATDTLTFVGKGSAGNGGWLLHYRLGFLALTFPGVVDIISPFSPLAEVDNHIIVVWRASGNTDFYFNGVKANVNTTGLPTTNAQPTTIGQTSSQVGNEATFGTYLSDVAIFNTALSDDRAAAHWAAGFQTGFQAPTTFPVSRFGPF